MHSIINKRESISHKRGVTMQLCTKWNCSELGCWTVETVVFGMGGGEVHETGAVYILQDHS